jgi:hypothetical protein
LCLTLASRERTRWGRVRFRKSSARPNPRQTLHHGLLYKWGSGGASKLILKDTCRKPKTSMEVKFTTYFPILRTLLVKYVIDTISNRPKLQKGDQGFYSGHDFSPTRLVVIGRMFRLARLAPFRSAVLQLSASRGLNDRGLSRISNLTLRGSPVPINLGAPDASAPGQRSTIFCQTRRGHLFCAVRVTSRMNFAR